MAGESVVWNEKMSNRKIAVKRAAGMALIGALAIPGSVSTLARPTPGYGDLIDQYCISQGRLRVAAHQSHCAMCHQTGTFDSLPAHRVQPNWTEFENAKATGDFSFFCPGGGGAAFPSLPSGGTGIQRPATGAGASPHAMPMPPANAPQPPSVADRQPAVAAEVEDRLKRFRDEVGIGQPEPAAWTAFAEAVRAAAAADRRAFADQTSREAPDALSLARQQERRLSARIGALRYVATAFTRLLPELNDQQRKIANERFALILEVL
ncbi:MAG: hypothetical protein HYX38_20950 [Rhodospirillales bacterium]|nr:hypothetical protein [Rhodospirillales bacterium]